MSFEPPPPPPGKWRWLTFWRETTCKFCYSLDQVEVEEGQPFGIAPYYGLIYGPPAHPNCYCEVVWIPDEGGLLGWFCVGVDLWGTYADGDGGEYTALIEADSWHCGGSGPNPDPPVNPFPPAGTLLRTFCEGPDLWGEYADGYGEYYWEVIEEDSPSCSVPDPFPPAGTLLSTYCQGFELWGIYADGAGGVYHEQIDYDAEECHMY